MIKFIADNHYQAHCGVEIYKQLRDEFAIEFYEDDFTGLESLAACKLLILHMISSTSGNELPGREIEESVHNYLKNGGNVLMLHGSSAAFWHWKWWRKIVGHRWVRKEDPDSIPNSTHPIMPYKVTLCHSDHELQSKLVPMSLPEDEVYIDLYQESPTIDLMESLIDNRRYVQCWANQSPWGGQMIGYLPGHAQRVLEHPDYLSNLREIIKHLI
ncbi:MAG: ThuA domain-containing protein [Lentisphaerales bacterium]|nr:ThuA domain-containing protein [Lentisphaerales bacterium]